MEPIKITGSTRAFGAPVGWNEDVSGPCQSLPILDYEQDNNKYLVSGWKLTEREIIQVQAGLPIYLWINGPTHPVVWLSVGFQEDDRSLKQHADFLRHKGLETMYEYHVQLFREWMATTDPDLKRAYLIQLQLLDLDIQAQKESLENTAFVP
jgi:hypothetical protein